MAFEYVIDSYSADRKKSSGRLIWGERSYAAVSGPYGAGTIPLGNFTVRTRNVATGNEMEAGYCITDATGKLCYFIPLQPNFSVGNRSGFGIHPDGNVPGSEGCVALPASAYRTFWKDWLDTPLSDRPTSLTVRDA